MDQNNQILDDERDTIEYSDTIFESVFIGKIPFSTILEKIEEQFSDYINTEDGTDYVDVFYDQLSKSYIVIGDDGEEHPSEAKDVLYSIYYIFIDKITGLFANKLNINITNFENSNIDKEQLEYILHQLYIYFILNAKENFKIAITNNINEMSIDGKPNPITSIEDTDEYITALMDLYSPLLMNISPIEFIRLTGNQDIYDLFDSQQVIGNFLTKYSPKLYKNEFYLVELINHINIMDMI